MPKYEEEQQRTDVQHAPHKLKGDKKDIKRNTPLRLRRKLRRVTRKQQLRRFFFLFMLFLMTLGVAVYLVYEHYHIYPGNVERDSVRLMGKGTDYLAFRWNGARNTDEYKVYFKEYVREGYSGTIENEEDAKNSMQKIDDSWEEKSTTGTEILFGNLKEGTTYVVAVRADSADMKGRITTAKTFSTKKKQTLKIADKITKLTVSKPFKLEGDAMTDLRYESSDTGVAEIDKSTGEIVIKGAGVTNIKVEALESAHYSADSRVVELQVFESNPVKAGGARAYTIHHLSADNCEVVKEVTGAGGAVVPQSLAYTGDKYIIAYGMGNPDRIISFDIEGNGKEVSVPKLSIGHPNGFTYVDENKTCYCVKGMSTRAVTYKPETGEYGAMNFSYGCSGIAYDRKEKLIYTSSKTLMASYDISQDYSVVNTTGVVRHSGSLATQDIGAHAGIMIRCLSPNANTHAINFIDLYDMRNGTYLGSFSCDLSEVESAIVNKDGFLEILANNLGPTDYIWRTNINIETLAEGIDY